MQSIHHSKTSAEALNHFDIIIIGGGMAGSSMALLLAESGFKIAIVEKNSYQQNEQASFDDRCIALSWSSKKIFQKMGIWHLLEQQQADTAHVDDMQNRSQILARILDIHVSDQGKLGVTRLNHRQENVSALGYVVESRALGSVLTEQVAEKNNIQLFCPAQISHLEFTRSAAEVDLSLAQKTMRTSAELVIAADGANSIGHSFLEQAPQFSGYGQTAIIANVETEYPHQNVAYERFTPDGPLAMLPLTRGRCSLVWTVKDECVEAVMALEDKEFLSQLQQNFGHRLGKITRTGKRFAYPLSLMRLNSDAVKKLSRLVFIGNAAHSVHPVAGQGFNLGLRDIAVLADLLEKNQRQQSKPFIFSDELIEQYWSLREQDIKRVGQMTDSLIRVFSNNRFPWTPGRDIGLILADIITPLKHKIAHQAMGKGIIPIG